jgi:hypothetical protein
MHVGLAWVVLAAVVAQFFFAGLGIFGAAGFGMHKMTGYLIEVAALLLLLLALIGGLGRVRTGLAALLLVLTVVQSLLPSAASLIAALHPVNAAAILAVAGTLARRGMEPMRGLAPTDGLRA